MQFHFWYIFIHIGLGLIGIHVFTFTNIGSLYAAAASGVVQAYAIYEIHRAAKPKFDVAYAAEKSAMQRAEMLKGYRIRLARVWFFRTCLYSLLTLITGLAARGGAHT